MFLISYILAFIALALLIVVYVFNFFFVHLEDVSIRGYLREMSKTQFKLAKEIDIFGNYAFADLWGWMFSKGGYRYGRKGETISSATGKKQLEGTLTITGWVLNIILWIVDIPNWFNGGHSVQSIQTDLEINNWLKNENI